MFDYIREKHFYSLLCKMSFEHRQQCKFVLAHLRRKMGQTNFQATSGLKTQETIPFWMKIKMINIILIVKMQLTNMNILQDLRGLFIKDRELG